MKKYLAVILSVMSMMYSCSDDLVQSVIETGTLPININAEYPVKGVGTRATDNGFVADDAVGIFVVDYTNDGNPGELVTKGNRADNVKFTFDGGNWKANYQLYWGSKNTPADFYGYYPFNDKILNVTEYPFSIYKNQDGTTADKSNYEQSDLLWAKAEKVQPTADAVQLQYRHLMAGIIIQLQKGTGFEASEWAGLEKTVLVDNVQTSATVNLQTGKITADNSEDLAVLKPLIYNNMWRAVVVPQTVAAGKRLLNITVDDKNYSLTKQESMQFVSGKMHNFTITVNKNTATGEYTFELTADDIVAWVDDADLHDGLVRQYIVVDVNEAGTLSHVLAERGVDYEKVGALKVVGNINHCDMEFMGQQMKKLTNLNLAKTTLCADEHLEAGTITGFADHLCLKHIVFPEQGMKKIGNAAFHASGLFGSLIIPEGVVEIGSDAFDNADAHGNAMGVDSKLNGTLTLPSTLKRIGDRAFMHQTLHGELILPEGLEYMGSGEKRVFKGCLFSGPLTLPSSLRKMSVPSGNFTGTITIPNGITSFCVLDNDFTVNNGLLEIHEGITELNIRGCGFAGELVLPSTMKKISHEALSDNKFSKIIMNDNTLLMENYAMANNGYLTSVVLSKNLMAIPEYCFENCGALQSITIPSNVEIIGICAFKECSALGSIVCEREEPPVVGKDAFFGVNKDNFTIEVPKGCVQKYREADGWKEFKRIAEYSNFVCRPAQVNALNNAHSENIILNADGAWTVKYKPDWVRLNKTSGTTKSEIQLTFMDMPHGNGMREDRIVFQMGDVETYCDLKQYDYEHEEDSYITLQQHSKGNGIDIVFMGDGWTGADISNGAYLDMVRQQTEYFFGVEPYKSHRDYFNVYVTFPLSQEKGVNTMYTYVNNRFGTLIGIPESIECGVPPSSQLKIEADEVVNYAIKNSPLEAGNRWKAQLIVIPNSDEYEGVTYYEESTGLGLSLCPPSNRPYPQDTRGVVQHEACGHGFGKLGDESVLVQKWIKPEKIEQIEKMHNRGWYRNLSTTSKMSQVWWADMIFDPRYSDQVDVFEGGYGFMRGVFRPENNSCMNYGIPYFNAPSRKDIIWRILEYSGVGYSDEYFYSHDTNAWGDRDGQTRAGAANASLTGTAITKSNNHCEPMVINTKAMGNQVRKIINRIKNK